MTTTPAGYMRKPAAPGQVAPELVRDVVTAVQDRHGSAAATALLQAAGLQALPGPGQSIDQSIARDLHRALRRTMPDDCVDVLYQAGQATADALISTQLSPRAMTMLKTGPWTVAAWLLGRWARQNSWTFAGSGKFVPLARLEFDLSDNPLIAGESADSPLCLFHEALFERMFQRLVEPNLICREVSCAGMGAPSCRFVVALG
jgi:divinyl protochlorophyllide a 8-vinyl-reductase